MDSRITLSDRPRRAHRARRQRPGRAVLVGLCALMVSAAALALVTGASGALGPGAGWPGAAAGAPADGQPADPGTRPRDGAPPGPGTAAVVRRGGGTFQPARGSAGRVGAGDLLRYRVEVEDGIGQDPAEFARWVDRILADPRGWTGDGRWAFQRPGSGKVDFVVRLASPDTVDEVCGRYGLDTFGEVSCRGGADVVINLRRWLQAVPGFQGDVDTYRHAVVNHEVGHFLGHDHESCPGRGEPMPVMGTPYYGLDGCRPNGWPYPQRR